MIIHTINVRSHVNPWKWSWQCKMWQTEMTVQICSPFEGSITQKSLQLVVAAILLVKAHTSWKPCKVRMQSSSITGSDFTSSFSEWDYLPMLNLPLCRPVFPVARVSVRCFLFVFERRQCNFSMWFWKTLTTHLHWSFALSRFFIRHSPALSSFFANSFAVHFM